MLPPYNHKGFSLLTALTLTASVASFAVFSDGAEGAVIITGEETGGNVIFTYSGKIDTTVLDSPINAGTGKLIDPINSRFFSSGDDNFTNNRFYLIFLPGSGPTNFGTAEQILASSATGDLFGFSNSKSSLQIALKNNYVSNDPINGSLTFDNATFSSLGVDDSQSYIWTLLPNNDTITLQFASPTPVPEPSMVLGTVVVLGLGGLFGKRK
ncbi:MAG: PEP-CTERM sorting domain-containing protein [Cyanobacterium sp. T60_A2020_053]|nr:PEP-CTERM sorting domain-containing protein [Cyanobacterium sp. T60_A2020_053]